jgi:hypothetical protein
MFSNKWIRYYLKKTVPGTGIARRKGTVQDEQHRYKFSD